MQTFNPMGRQNLAPTEMGKGDCQDAPVHKEKDLNIIRDVV